MTFKAALFDLDDTLLKSAEMKMLQHQVIAKRYWDLDIPHDTIRQAWGKPLSVMIPEMYQAVDETERILEILLDTDPEFPKGVFDGSADAVVSLLDADVHVGVITSAPTKPAIADLHRLGFPVDRMFCVLGEDSVDAHKPDPAVFDEPMRFLSDQQVRTEEVVYVGDHLVDLMAATARGFGFIAVTSGLIDATEFKAAGAEVVSSGVIAAVELILGSGTAESTGR
jgi:phosphoglycolate phosphatase-like HAD superfamily hydrolase